MISDIFKFFLQSFYQPFQQLPAGESVTRVVRPDEQKFQYQEVITQADILAVSDGTGLVAAHTCTEYNLIAGELELLATTLYPCGKVRKVKSFHS